MSGNHFIILGCKKATLKKVELGALVHHTSLTETLNSQELPISKLKEISNFIL